MRIRRPWALLLLGLPVVFLLAFFVGPFTMVVVASLADKTGQWSLTNYVKALSDPYYWDTLLLTFRLSLWVTVAALVIGYPLAYYMTDVLRHPALRRLFYVVVVTPLF